MRRTRKSPKSIIRSQVNRIGWNCCFIKLNCVSKDLVEVAARERARNARPDSYGFLCIQSSFFFITRSNYCEGNMGDQSPRLHISCFHPIRLCCMPSWRDACTGDSSSEMEESFCTRPPSPIPTALSSLIRFLTNRRWNFTQYYAVPYTLCTLLLHRRDVSWKQGDIGIKVIIDSTIAEYIG